MAHEDALYDGRLVGLLELVWGDGFLSPGGPDEVDRVLDGLGLTDRSVLDIGCGVGGIDVHLVQRHGAGYVSGIDVEDNLLAEARARVARHGLSHRIGVAKVAPGPLPFPPGAFQLVFSKDSILHIPDKESLAHEVFRVLRPGGWFAASDWLMGHDGEPSPAMRDYIAAEGLAFGMASPGRYAAALRDAGFVDVTVTSRQAWYLQTARDERRQIQGPLYAKAVETFGAPFVDHNIDLWTAMITLLETGELCPSHLRARRPI